MRLEEGFCEGRLIHRLLCFAKKKVRAQLEQKTLEISFSFKEHHENNILQINSPGAKN
jgi:hypothetical protein